VNRSQQQRAASGLVTDGGAPRCAQCAEPLRFDSDRDGRTIQSCAHGHRAYLRTRRSDAGVAAVRGAR
jgi:hypothetical protein